MSPLWTTEDNSADDKPKYLNSTDKSNTHGVDDVESATNPEIAHTGWNLKTTGSGGRSGRVHYECLVAGGITDGDQDADEVQPSSSSSSSAGE